jgi:hypothetical protein
MNVKLDKKELLQDIINAMEEHDGSIRLEGLYIILGGKYDINFAENKNKRDKITKIIYTHSSDSKQYIQSNEDLFEKLSDNEGIWGLRK